jgi:hypothetical protein
VARLVALHCERGVERGAQTQAPVGLGPQLE